MVISTVNQVVYNGDGITTAWPYTFRIIDATDIKLTIIDADGAETDVTADYFVDTVNNTVYYPGYAPGAEPPQEDQPPVLALGQKLIVYRQLPVTQEKNLGKKWPFSVIELGLDKLTMLIQDIYGWANQRFMQEKDNSWDARKFPIHNVGGPVNVDDAATKDYVDRILNGFVLEGDSRTVPFDNVAQMITADLEVCQIAFTLGYHDINDHGAGVYSIRAKVPGDADDGGGTIFLDNDNVAELIVYDTVNVKQFGGYGDGVTDDTEALQNCIDYAKAKDLAVLLNGKFYITDTIDVPARSRLIGQTAMYTYGSYIIVDPTCSLALDMTRGQVNMRDVVVMAKDNIYAPNTDGVYLLGNAYNADSNFVNVDFNYLRKGATVCGRNVVFLNCGFSHCQYGIHYDFDDDVNQIRGLIVDGCRFHGIGEEADLNWFENSYAIYFAKQKWSQLTVVNCTSDQGGCFLYGYGGDFQIENNFIESFKSTPIQLGESLSAAMIPAQNGTVLIQGNIIRGKGGSPAVGVTVDYPPHAVSVNYLGRVVISNNTISKFAYEAISVSNAVTTIAGNTVQSVGLSDSFEYLLKLDSAYAVVTNNRNVGLGTMYIAKTTSASKLYQSNNYSITISPSTYANITIDKDWMSIGTITGGTAVTLNLPKEFWLTFSYEGDLIIFHCYRIGSYISSGYYRAGSVLTYELYWGANLVPVVQRNNNGTITTGTWTMSVFINNF